MSSQRRIVLACMVGGALATIVGGAALLRVGGPMTYMSMRDIQSKIELEIRATTSTVVAAPVPVLANGSLRVRVIVYPGGVREGSPPIYPRPHTRILADPRDARIVSVEPFTPVPFPPWLEDIPWDSDYFDKFGSKPDDPYPETEVQLRRGDALIRDGRTFDALGSPVWRSYELGRHSVFVLEQEERENLYRFLWLFRSLTNADAFPFQVAEAPDFFRWALDRALEPAGPITNQQEEDARVGSVL